MYCRQCGSNIADSDLFCALCGFPVSADVVAEEAAPSSKSIPQGAQGLQQAVANAVKRAGVSQETFSGYRSFEYATTTVACDLAQAAMDGYESLGYELTGQKLSSMKKEIVLSFRRSRNVRGKAQLAKIQRSMDDVLASIAQMEEEKSRKATIQALAIGIVSALVLGVGMCCTMVWQGLMIIGIVVGVLGIVGCIGAFLRYRAVFSRESKRLASSIEKAYERLATLCEEAQAVLRSAVTEQSAQA